MEFEDWHVVENKETHKQHIICGAIEDTIKEPNTYIEIPFSQWSVDHMIEIVGNVYGDITSHNMRRELTTIKDCLNKAHIIPSDQREFFQWYILAIFDRLSY